MISIRSQKTWKKKMIDFWEAVFDGLLIGILFWILYALVASIAFTPMNVALCLVIGIALTTISKVLNRD